MLFSHSAHVFFHLETIAGGPSCVFIIDDRRLEGRQRAESLTGRTLRGGTPVFRPKSPHH